MSALSAANDEQLAINIVAKLGDLEKQMAKANGITARAYREMSLSSKKATASMEADAIRSTTRMNQAFASVSTKIGAFGQAMSSTLGVVGRGFAGGVLGGLAAGGLVGLVGNLGTVARGIAEIGDQAKIAGVNVEAFQELKYVAEQNRIGIDALTDGLKEMNLRADEFITTGSGSGAEAFQRLGYNATDLATKLKEPSALFAEIIGRLGKMDRAAQIRIADEIFGGSGGEKFVQLIDQGEAGIRDTIQAANDLGTVMDAELIDKASELDQKFQAVSSTVGTALKSAIVSAADSLAGFIESFRAFENQSAQTLQNRLAGLGAERVDIENKILALKDQDRQGFVGSWGADNSQAISVLEDQQRAISEEEGKILSALQQRQPVQPVASPAPSESWTPPVIAPKSGSKSKGGGSKSSDLERETASVREHIDALNAETQALQSVNPLVDDYGYAVEFARTKQDLLNAAQKDGRQITPELLASIEQLSAGYANASASATKLADSQDQVRQSAEEWNSLGRDMVGGFISDLRNGTSLADSFANAIGKVADKLIDDLLNSLFQVNGAGGGGGLFSFLSGLFGGSSGPLNLGSFLTPSAKGNVFNSPGLHAYRNTVVSRPTIFPFASGGAFGLMGEAGAEAVMPLKRDASGRLGVSAHGAVGGASVTNSMTMGDITINVPEGTDPKDAGRIGTEVSRQLKQMMQSEMRNQMRSGGMLNKGVFG